MYIHIYVCVYIYIYVERHIYIYIHKYTHEVISRVRACVSAYASICPADLPIYLLEGARGVPRNGGRE